MIGFALSVLLVALPVVTVGADNAASDKQKKEKIKNGGPAAKKTASPKMGKAPKVEMHPQAVELG